MMWATRDNYGALIEYLRAVLRQEVGLHPAVEALPPAPGDSMPGMVYLHPWHFVSLAECVEVKRCKAGKVPRLRLRIRVPYCSDFATLSEDSLRPPKTDDVYLTLFTFRPKDSARMPKKGDMLAVMGNLEFQKDARGNGGSYALCGVFAHVRDTNLYAVVQSTAALAAKEAGDA